jgi:hypothetical protein
MQFSAGLPLSEELSTLADVTAPVTATEILSVTRPFVWGSLPHL